MAVDARQLKLNGQLIEPGDDDYDRERRLYNAMFDKRPALIARCAEVADVVSAVNFARTNGLATAIRCGGHNGAGLGSIDGGLVIDLAGLKGVSVDPDSKLARVAGGSLFGEIDTATHEFGLATPGGIISTTGAGGLVLGGGIGHLTRKYGLSIDNLVAAEVVLADGSVVVADEQHNDDLLWALRGGGGNFGVVTSMTLRLHPVSTVVGGPMFWPIEHARELLRWYLEWRPSTPDDLNSFFLFHSVPPAPPFPEELWLQKVCGIAACWLGPADEADTILAEARSQPGLALDAVGPTPFPALQSAFDPIYPAGDQWYWRADFFDSVPDEAVDINAEWGERLPTWKSLMHLYTIDGAPHALGPTDTAWAYRDAHYAQVMCGVDPDPANADALRSWAVGYWDGVHPYSAGGAYVNFMMDEGQERVQATYGPNYERLAQIKRTYDPDNFFHVNQNIRPA
ncbi:MAG TPA: FAD-binding oxidoreductase [Gaiellaceae bacterium]|nr:FAD-binding oxidoreductase [Gaiellaceae bacterium]